MSEHGWMMREPLENRRSVPFREPAPVCATPKCEYPVRTDLELKLCEGCGKRFCGDCVRMFSELPFCSTCAVCKECGGVAVDICASCGDLCCAEHFKTVHSREQGSDQEDLVCKLGCQVDPIEIAEVRIVEDIECPW